MWLRGLTAPVAVESGSAQTDLTINYNGAFSFSPFDGSTTNMRIYFNIYVSTSVPSKSFRNVD